MYVKVTDGWGISASCQDTSQGVAIMESGGADSHSVLQQSLAVHYMIALKGQLPMSPPERRSLRHLDGWCAILRLSVCSKPSKLIDSLQL